MLNRAPSWTESHRDAGLLRAVGLWALTASIVSSVVGAGIFAVPGELAASAGSYAPIAFLVCAVPVGCVAICFAEGGSRVPTSGGAYGCVATAFGPFVGYVSGVLLWISNVLACGGIVAALADVVVGVVPAPWSAAARGSAILGVVLCISLVNVGGVKRGARLVDVITVVKLLPLVIFVVAGALAIRGSTSWETAAPSTHGLGRAMLLALFSLTGMETPLSASGEVAEPARTIPRALAIAMLGVTLLYVAIQVVAQGVLGSSLAHSTSPLADAMGRISPALRLLMLAGAAASMLGWIGSDLLGSPRILFALARDGLLPRALGRVHLRTRAPHVAISCHAALVVVLAASGTFSELAVLSTLAVAPLYLAGCAAGFRLARRGVRSAGAPLGFRWLGAAMGIGVASMLAMIALASSKEIVGLLALLAVVAGLVLARTTANARARREATRR
jgi:basic amino acid/polyamine antiporter, APA family